MAIDLWPRIEDARGDDSARVATLSVSHTINFTSGATAAQYPRGVRKFVVQEGVKKLKNFECANMSDLVTMELPSRLEEIGMRTFDGCSFRSIYLPTGLKTLLDFAFANCKKLGRVMVPADVTHIGVGIFEGCDSLEGVGVDECNSLYYSKGDCILTKNGNELIAGCGASIIPEECKTIRKYSFSNMNGLQIILLPDALEVIGESAFIDCKNLTVVTFGSGNLIIEDRAFSGCTALRDIALGEGSVSIGDYAFSGAENLRKVYIPAAVKQIGHGIFYGCEKLTTIYCEAKRKPMGWRKDWIEGTNAKVVWDANPPMHKLRKAEGSLLHLLAESD